MTKGRSQIELDNFEAGVVLAPTMRLHEESEIEDNPNVSRKRKEREGERETPRREEEEREEEEREEEERRRDWAEILACIPFHLKGGKYGDGEVPFMTSF